MNPGQGQACRDCRHFHPETWHRGHPSPCAMVRWENNRHREPSLREGGRWCDEYDGPDIGLSNHGSETESAETCHGENAPGPDIDDSAGVSLVEYD